MNFIFRNRIWLLAVSAALVLLLALFWPEPKKPGEAQKYYTLPQTQLLSIEYIGDMTLREKEKVRIEYSIQREENVLKEKEPLYRVEIKSLTASDTKLTARVAELSRVKKFYASALVRTIVQDWSEPDYYYIFKHENERDAEYGIKDCTNKVTLTFRSTQKKFCIGASSQGDTRRYLLDTAKDKVLITPDFTVRRLLNNIFAQREQSLYPHGTEGADLIEIKIGNEIMKKYAILQGKTGGAINLRMLVKNDGKEKTNVWHVEGLLSIKPSHAAELAQLVNGLRISALFTTDANAAAPLADAIKNADIAEKNLPAITGSVKLKKTDKQDAPVAVFAFYPPGVKPNAAIPYQFDNMIARPLDTLVVSQYNAGYISADNYPRLLSILTKMEGDLLEAQKKGEQLKAEKEKAEKGKKP